jgi:hypothetical protein
VIYLNTLLPSPDIISLIKWRRVGEDREPAVCSEEMRNTRKSTMLENVRRKSEWQLFDWKFWWDWGAWRRLLSKASQYSQFWCTNVSSQQVGYNAVDIYVNVIRIKRIFAYVFWLLCDFSGQFQDIASNLFHRSYLIYCAIFCNARSHKNASIALL